MGVARAAYDEATRACRYIMYFRRADKTAPQYILPVLQLTLQIALYM